MRCCSAIPGVRVRRTRIADRDIDAVLTNTLALFGERQLQRYADLIARRLRSLGDDPSQPTSRDEWEIGQGVRSVHLSDGPVRKRQRASHRIFDVWRPDTDEVVVLRCLHDRMEVRHRVRLALRDALTRS